MNRYEDELVRLMWEWANDGPHAPRVLDIESYPDVTMFVCAYSAGVKWADYDKALDQFSLEMHAAGRLGAGFRHRIAKK